ncbi:unnamed protein product [Brachionus calyciflorus]|uniref:N(4)-(beta-N-acetylglucosaminyl)-L-asparaginase n=1 Tax=Brachionus calyciflorus TaxID=104777 RepID=A0A813M2V3_9BILA|nr:unnamed protein product [Brachionus calyciflorus]
MYFRMLVFLVFFFNFASSKSVNNTKNLKFTQLSSCKAQLDDGSLIDLSSLDNPSSPRTVRDDDYDYKFNPCSPITCVSGARPTSAACEISTDGKVQYNLGDQSTAILTYSSNLVMKFTSGEKTASIQCLCDNSEKFSFVEERPINTYRFTFSSLCCCPNGCSDSKPNYPIVINTWPFVDATERAWEVLEKTDDPLLSVELGCSVCEDLRCDGTVGWGGSPDESGETTLDALIMDGRTHDAGSVAGLRRVKNVISVARAVMDHTKHTLLVGDAATQFAEEMGFRQEDLHHKDSVESYLKWLNNKCQPNFRLNVSPDPLSNCGPYTAIKPVSKTDKSNLNINEKSHDTIGMIAINSKGDISVGTSTNGAAHKIPGRVGDSPIIGSGGYVDNDVGAACGTGDGDILMKFLPSYQAVESMRNGMSPSKACENALERIIKKYPKFMGAIIAMDKDGNHGAACHGIDVFNYSYRSNKENRVQINSVKCI